MKEGGVRYGGSGGEVHTQLLIGVRGSRINWVLDGSLVLLYGDGALACAADIVVVGNVGGGSFVLVFRHGDGRARVCFVLLN